MVIAIVGVTAIVATTLGVVLYDEVAGNEQLNFELVTDEGFFSGTETGVSGGPREFAFALPDNATSAAFDVTVTFKGRAGQGGTVQVSAYFVDPTGNRSNEDQKTLTMSANEGPGDAVTLSLAGTWAAMPNGTETTDVEADAKAAATSWDGKPLIVYITISAPAGDGLVGVVPQVNYSYDIALTGDLSRYQRDFPPVPNPTGGQ